MRRIWVFFLLLAVILGACNRVDEVPISDWIHHADFPGTPRASGAIFTIGTSAYLCCGRSGYNQYPLREIWQYNSLDSSWTQLDSFPGRARVKPIAVTIHGKGYVGMGSNDSIYEESVLRDFYEFDPTSGNWTQKASFPGNAANDMAFGVVNGCLYTAMGFTGVSRSSDSYKYDPTTDVWTRLEDCPGSYSAPAFFTIGNDFYVGSGFQGRNLRTFFRFDTEQEKWHTIASLPEGRIMSNGLGVGEKGYVMLGRFWNGVENNGRMLSDIIEYNPMENSWIRKGDFPGGARQNSMVFTLQGRGYIVMGETIMQRLSDVWSFKP